MSPLAAVARFFYSKNQQRAQAHRSRVEHATKRRRGFNLELLEPRLLLSADLAFGAAGNTETALALKFAAASNQCQLLDSANAVVSLADAADAVDGGVKISGSDGDDQLTLDMSNLSSVEISFLGEGGNALVVAGDGQRAQALSQRLNEASGGVRAATGVPGWSTAGFSRSHSRPKLRVKPSRSAKAPTLGSPNTSTVTWWG